jgi:hypothetical protein
LTYWRSTRVGGLARCVRMRRCLRDCLIPPANANWGRSPMRCLRFHCSSWRIILPCCGARIWISHGIWQKVSRSNSQGRFGWFALSESGLLLVRTVLSTPPCAPRLFAWCQPRRGFKVPHGVSWERSIRSHCCKIPTATSQAWTPTQPRSQLGQALRSQLSVVRTYGPPLLGGLLCQTPIGEHAGLHESRNTRDFLSAGSPTTTEDLTRCYEGLEPIAQ